jgi:hypothetical protein
VERNERKKEIARQCPRRRTTPCFYSIETESIPEWNRSLGRMNWMVSLAVIVKKCAMKGISATIQRKQVPWVTE